MSCARESEWWDVMWFQHFIRSDDYYLGDCFCYGFSTFNMSGSFGGGPTLDARWRDASHRIVAVSIGYPNAPVVCGPFHSLSNVNDILLPDGGLAPGFTSYDQDPENPDCAIWKPPRCASGCCSGQPPKLP